MSTTKNIPCGRVERLCVAPQGAADCRSVVYPLIENRVFTVGFGQWEHRAVDFVSGLWFAAQTNEVTHDVVCADDTAFFASRGG